MRLKAKKSTSQTRLSAVNKAAANKIQIERRAKLKKKKRQDRMDKKFSARTFSRAGKVLK